MLKNIWQTVLNLLLPARCVDCRQNGNYLCETCASRLPRAPETENRESLAVFDYNDPRVKRLIWQLKYRGLTALAPALSRRLHEELLNTLADWYAYHPGSTERWLVVPVPLAPTRLRRRGYNQAERLAYHLSQLDPNILELDRQILLKVRETPTQVSQRDRQRRLGNLRDAFAVARPELVRGRQIIVVDDVMTTGATLAETRRILKAAGAKSVLGITLAHG